MTKEFDVKISNHRVFKARHGMLEDNTGWGNRFLRLKAMGEIKKENTGNLTRQNFEVFILFFKSKAMKSQGNTSKKNIQQLVKSCTG